MFQKLIRKFPGKVIPANGFLCTNHRKGLNEEKHPVEKTGETDDDDPNYDTKAFEITVVNKEKLANLAEAADTTPVKFNISTPVNELSDSTKRYMKRKLQHLDGVAKLFCENVAPGQSNDLLSLFTKRGSV
ncbi:hypothetical protein AVEN_84442-1 [Araneus ventricosus]|uniref:Uncharacterized protein n=1 Tax=Araneus ventricosus TaxID=182803 RepID=A0A4Y2S0W6_ARAVE|nr:hypothetical protein AVEN_84442-1 [Araneus ventricosus]